MSQLYQKCQQHSRLRFLNEYEQTLEKLRSEFGEIIVKHNSKGTLMSSMFFSDLWKVTTPAAKYLSNKRLELDINALETFGFTIQENAKWLKENQNALLLTDFWKQFVLTEYQRPLFDGRGTFGENQIWQELNKILHQIEREIDVLESEPIKVQQPPIATNNFIFNGGQNNLSLNNSTQTVNNGPDIQETIIKLVELLKASELPEDFKKDTMTLAETFAEESKAGQPSESTRKSLVEKLLVIKDPATTISAAINITSAVYTVSNHLFQLIHMYK